MEKKYQRPSIREISYLNRLERESPDEREPKTDSYLSSKMQEEIMNRRTIHQD